MCPRPGIRAPHRPQAAARAADAGHDDFLFFKTDGIERKVHLTEIVYLEGYGNYIKVHTDGETVLISETMKAMESKLPRRSF